MPGGHHSFPGIISFYIQLVTPSVVVTAVNTATMICITVFQNSLFFILSSFIFNHE